MNSEKKIDTETDREIKKTSVLGQKLAIVEKMFEDKSRELYFSREKLATANEALQKQAVELGRLNAQLEAANKELEAFSYSVSHDLRAPLRTMDGFSRNLMQKYGGQLDDQANHYLERIRVGCQRMGQLIQDMLNLSRLTRYEMKHDAVNLSCLAKQVAEDLKQNDPSRQVRFVIADGMTVIGTKDLLHIVLENLLGNAWKFTSKHTTGVIEFGVALKEGKRSYFIKDDGAGFDMNHVGQLFGAFQRLHQSTEFSGTGIGLASVQRIIHRHQGRIWAMGEIEKGATFFFTLNEGGANG